MNFIQALLLFAEKAAKIARSIRENPCLFALLIEEKGKLEKNMQFVDDFKTLADVLIQESLRHYVSLKFPNFAAESILGEESSTFTNTLGENIAVRVCSSRNETATLLKRVLDGNHEAANKLAEIIHEETMDIDVDDQFQVEASEFSLENIGIWIDPIDSTAEYINGKSGDTHVSTNVYHDGLPCVTVLIGLYDKQSGASIGGIINQPFAIKDSQTSRWISKIYYGLSYDDVRIQNQFLTKHTTVYDKSSIVVSSSESQKLLDELRKHYTIINATGAGYKSLIVALGLVDAYICSKGSTYRWDTCAPHGILMSLGGGIISFAAFLQLGKSQHLEDIYLQKHQLTYHKGNDIPATSHNEVWCNRDGVIAYRSQKTLIKIYESVKYLQNNV